MQRPLCSQSPNRVGSLPLYPARSPVSGFTGSSSASSSSASVLSTGARLLTAGCCCDGIGTELRLMRFCSSRSASPFSALSRMAWEKRSEPTLDKGCCCAAGTSGAVLSWTDSELVLVPVAMPRYREQLGTTALGSDVARPVAVPRQRKNDPISMIEQSWLFHLKLHGSTLASGSKMSLSLSRKQLRAMLGPYSTLSHAPIAVPVRQNILCV